MEFLASLPMVFAALILLLAAALKVGKEKGSIFLLLGGTGTLLMSIISPVYYTLIFPKLMENGPPDNPEVFFAVQGMIVNTFWALPLVMIAVAVFMRPPANKDS